MTLRERSGWRDESYSRWHRPDRLERFIPRPEADALGLLDIDWVEYCRDCGYPIALFEVTKDWSKPKNFRVTAILANLLGVPAYPVYYSVDDAGDITEFAVSHPAAEIILPADFARWLVELRRDHRCRDTLIPRPQRRSAVA